MRDRGLFDEEESRAFRRVAREARGTTIYTVGYEKRSGIELMQILLDNGVQVLADVRQRAMSRKPDFRGGPLAERCRSSGITYRQLPTLGSNDELRAQLWESRDYARFFVRFEKLARETMGPALDLVADLVVRRPTALLCYERDHRECHRCTIAKLLAERIDATIVAL